MKAFALTKALLFIINQLDKKDTLTQACLKIKEKIGAEHWSRVMYRLKKWVNEDLDKV